MVGGNAEIDTTNSMSDVFETSAIEGVSQSTAYSYIVPKLTYTSVLLAEGKNERHRCDARSGSSLVSAGVFCDLFQLISSLTATTSQFESATWSMGLLSMIQIIPSLFRSSFIRRGIISLQYYR